jgi:two-component system OmpR family sensor kinase
MRRAWRDISLSWRLTALYVAILAVVLTALGVVLYVRVEHFLVADTVDRLEAAAHSSVARSVAFRRGPGGQENPGSPSPDINRLNGLTGELSSRDTVARVVSADGTILATGQTFPDQPTPPICSPDDLRRVLAGETPPATTIRTGWQHLLVVLLPLQLGDSTPEVLQLTTSLAAADSLLAQLRLILALGALGAVVAGALLGVPVTRAALRPLARVTATSERIAAGDLGQRTDLPAGRDEIGRLAAAFDRMVDQLETTLRAQRQFVADASHELRTPLTSLGGLIEMVLLGADRGDMATTQRALRSAHREIERLARLVGDLLTLSRLDAHPAIARRPLDLATLAADVGEQTRFLAGERTVHCQVDGPLPVEGDADRLKQVLLNLTGNAVAFTGPTGRLELRAGRHGDRARVVVADNGVGIDPADVPHLFERFYRSDKSRARRRDDGGGSGLGLAIAQAILEAHSGTIAVQSTPGQGTTFTVELPLAAAATASAASARVASTPAAVP